MADQPIRQANVGDSAEIAELCALLWPDAPAAEHRIETEQLLKTKMCGTLPSTIFVSRDENGRITGFLLVDLRSHADGCDPARPVGYVEGWFVLEEHRRRGLGAAMMRAAEDWARSLGCKEMASDTWADERSSLEAHEALGFNVVDRCIHLRKSL